MIRRPPTSTRTDTLFPYTTLFRSGFVPALAATQSREAKELQDHARAQGENITLEPWDWGYYAEQVRKAKYDLDDAQIKPYFEVWRVLEDGVFHAANKTYGLTFKRRKDLPVYHPTMPDNKSEDRRVGKAGGRMSRYQYS